MDYAFTEEQEAFRSEVSRFAKSELAPREAADSEAGRFLPDAHTLARRLAEIGLTGLRIPAEYGGQGADCVTTGIAIEEIARYHFDAASLAFFPVLIGELLLGASKKMREQWIPPLAAGEVIPSLALTEADHGTDAATLTTRAERDGKGWRIIGEKNSVTGGMCADTCVVFARTGDPGARGVSAFYVDLDERYVSRSEIADFGCRAVGRAIINFDGLPVTPENLIGGEGEGFVRVMQGFDYSRALIGLMCVGCADEAIQDAAKYAKDRHAFGQPIGAFQGVSFPLAEHATFVRAARHMCYEVLWRRDHNMAHTVEAAMVKWWAPKVAVEAVHAALLTFGHYGYSTEAPHARRLANVIGMEIGDGTAQASKLIIARALLGMRFT